MGGEHGRGAWEGSMGGNVGGEHGRGAWEGSMGEEHGREAWELGLGTRLHNVYQVLFMSVLHN